MGEPGVIGTGASRTMKKSHSYLSPSLKAVVLDGFPRGSPSRFPLTVYLLCLSDCLPLRCHLFFNVNRVITGDDDVFAASKVVLCLIIDALQLETMKSPSQASLSKKRSSHIDETNIPGLSHAKRRSKESVVRSGMWVALFLVGISLTSLQVSKVLRSYFDYPVDTKVLGHVQYRHRQDQPSLVLTEMSSCFTCAFIFERLQHLFIAPTFFVDNEVTKEIFAFSLQLQSSSEPMVVLTFCSVLHFKRLFDCGQMIQPAMLRCLCQTTPDFPCRP